MTDKIYHKVHHINSFLLLGRDFLFRNGFTSTVKAGYIGLKSQSVSFQYNEISDIMRFLWPEFIG